jgi:hypothetical protein
MMPWGCMDRAQRSPSVAAMRERIQPARRIGFERPTRESLVAEPIERVGLKIGSKAKLARRRALSPPRAHNGIVISRFAALLTAPHVPVHRHNLRVS